MKKNSHEKRAEAPGRNADTVYPQISQISQIQDGDSRLFTNLRNLENL
jgi:hypothetical protein